MALWILSSSYTNIRASLIAHETALGKTLRYERRTQCPFQCGLSILINEFHLCFFSDTGSIESVCSLIFAQIWVGRHSVRLQRKTLRDRASSACVQFRFSLNVIFLKCSSPLFSCLLLTVRRFRRTATVYLYFTHIPLSSGMIFFVACESILFVQFDIRLCRANLFAHLGVCGVAFLLLLPMLTYARANEVLLHQLRQADPVNRRENVTRVRVYKCSDMMPPYVFYWFTCR